EGIPRCRRHGPLGFEFGSGEGDRVGDSPERVLLGDGGGHCRTSSCHFAPTESRDRLLDEGEGGVCHGQGRTPSNGRLTPLGTGSGGGCRSCHRPWRDPGTRAWPPPSTAAGFRPGA